MCNKHIFTSTTFTVSEYILKAVLDLWFLSCHLLAETNSYRFNYLILQHNCIAILLLTIQAIVKIPKII